MITEIKIPSAGESVTEAAIGNWLVADGTYVQKDQEIAEVETDKATLPLIASESGTLHIIAKAGEKVHIGDVACTIDTDGKPEAAARKAAPKQKSVPVPSVAAATSEEHVQQPVSNPPETIKDTPPEEPAEVKKPESSIKMTPLAKNIMVQNDLDIESIITGLKKITKQEVEQVLQSTQPAVQHTERGVKKIPMSPLRRKLSKRLVSVKNETAMLTTFNEVDMSNLMDLRKKFQSKFQEKYNLKLGLVSFFTLACSRALMQFPQVNSYLEGDDMITPDYVDIAIAVQTDKGLMVPVIRNAGTMSIAMIEKSIATLAEKARTSKLTIDEMTGGTFTITNGGIFGSMLSTPIINPPQSAILGMHNIVDRPVAINGRVEIRPIMYVALSYDHRLIDGRESVSFLFRIKEFIENPVYMLFDKPDPEKVLLGL
jgi:2-oxoglutarate dehydrogenase E2 component (dihydrolipoamide succinyltransferase)